MDDVPAAVPWATDNQRSSGDRAGTVTAGFACGQTVALAAADDASPLADNRDPGTATDATRHRPTPPGKCVSGSPANRRPRSRAWAKRPRIAASAPTTKTTPVHRRGEQGALREESVTGPGSPAEAVAAPAPVDPARGSVTAGVSKHHYAVCQPRPPLPQGHIDTAGSLSRERRTRPGEVCRPQASILGEQFACRKDFMRNSSHKLSVPRISPTGWSTGRQCPRAAANSHSPACRRLPDP